MDPTSFWNGMIQAGFRNDLKIFDGLILFDRRFDDLFAARRVGSGRRGGDGWARRSMGWGMERVLAKMYERSWRSSDLSSNES